MIEPVLKKLEERYPNIRIVVIADRKPDMALRSVQFIPWNKQSEANDLANLDIGIMPLPDDEWAKGKCGFKALQYMALKIPAVISPVGVNTKIIDAGVNGFLAVSDDEWMNALQRLIEDPSLRKQLGEAGRKTVVENYSVISTSSSFVSLFE